MVICPQCNIQHDPKEQYCRQCGSFLLDVEDPPLGQEKTEVKLTCPKCRVVYRKGNYCRKCGSLLMQGTPHQEIDVQPLGKKLVRRLSKESLRLLKEEKELESCISNLEAQRDRISGDILSPIFARYKHRLESLSPLHQEIQTELKSIQKKASEQIDLLEKDLEPIQKRLGEFRSLYKTGAITKDDFIREKNALRREIKSRERSLEEYRQMRSLLPSEMEGGTLSPGLPRDLLRPFTLMMAGVMVLLIVVGGYFLWPRHSQSSRPVSEEIIAPAPSTPPRPDIRSQEIEKIESVFENIKKANLKKNIDLFMSCFSRDFKGRDGKRLDTIKMWGTYNYLDLSYALKKQTISEDTANVRLEWLVKTSQKEGGQLQDSRTILDVTLKREDGRWKIKEIKPVS